MAAVPGGRHPKQLVWARSRADARTRSLLLVHHGPGNIAFAIQVIGWTFVLDPVLIDIVGRFMPDSWFHVHEGERVIHRLLGVSVFSRLLELSGWNNVIVRPVLKAERYRPGTKANLAVRANSARSGGGAHTIRFALHVLLAAATIFVGYPWNTLWVLLPGVVVHLYPALLQRSILLRLHPLLDRARAATS